MALTTRGKASIAVVAVLLGGSIVAVALSGSAPAPIRKALSGIGIAPDPIEPCPLTGKMLPGDKPPPNRPLLAVKVENTPDAQPLSGLQEADIVYEEVVEGGITRFVALFQCSDVNRVGPVRSVRTTDPKTLVPFSEHPLLAFSGGATGVLKVVEEAGITTMDEASVPKAFNRDEERVAPHNLYTSTKPLWGKGKVLAKDEPIPDSPFVYSDELPSPSRRVRTASVVFSGLATAEWRWSNGLWVRYLDGSPMMLEGGDPITADNLVIQVVKTTQSKVFTYSPEVHLTGKGKAWVLRDGKLIVGRWERSDEGDFTTFLTRSRQEISLEPGRTFVELAPVGMFDAEISFS